MEPITEEFTITLKYQVKVDTETGEMTTKCISRKVDKSNFEISESKPKRKIVTPKEESSNPTLVLEDNKYCLNQAAINLMGVNPDDKLDIKYEKQGKVMVPVIGTDEVFGTRSGCRLTKSHTVSCRGSKNTELAKFGTEFTIVPHSSKEGLFILTSKNNPVQEELDGDENIALDDSFDIDLSDLDNEDANITEIDSNFFKL